jgi:hypothetical protein
LPATSARSAPAAHPRSFGSRKPKETPMSSHIGRREVLIALCGFPLLGILSGCDGSTRHKTVKIVLAVLKKLDKITSTRVAIEELVLEINAIIDGKEEKIETYITKEEAEALQNGGQLVIKDKTGKEFPVEYTKM